MLHCTRRRRGIAPAPTRHHDSAGPKPCRLSPRLRCRRRWRRRIRHGERSDAAGRDRATRTHHAHCKLRQLHVVHSSSSPASISTHAARAAARRKLKTKVLKWGKPMRHGKAGTRVPGYYNILKNKRILNLIFVKKYKILNRASPRI